MIALPPSPTPEHNIDTDEIPAMQKPENRLDQNNDQRSGDETPSSPQSPIPTTDGVQGDDERQEVQEQEQELKASPISSDTIANPISVTSHSNSSVMTSTIECPTTPQSDLLIQKILTPLSSLPRLPSPRFSPPFNTVFSTLLPRPYLLPTLIYCQALMG